MLDFFVGDVHIQANNPDKTSSDETGQMARVFNAINANLSSELVGKIGAIYQFNVKGDFFLFILIYKCSNIY